MGIWRKPNQTEGGSEVADEEVREEAVEEEPAAEEVEERREAFGQETTDGIIHIETGRGQTTEVQAGAPFGETIERVADEAHYGGFFRVFLNGEEILNPEEAPEKIEPGMRIAITSYDKVG